MKRDIWAQTQQVDGDAELPPSPLLGAKVMMVDDDPMMTELIQTHLEDAGYCNFVATNDPRDTLPMLRREQPGVLLLDLMMPMVSGFDVLEAIRADPALRYTSVIVLTAAAKEDAKLHALQLGATDFLSKPVDPSELVLRVRNTLAYHQYHDRLIHFDPVTGLPNRRLFQRAIAEVVAQRDVCGGMVALFSITVPEWRQLYTALDEESFDRFAKVLARRLDQIGNGPPCVMPQGTPVDRAPRAARLGAEQFAVLVEGLADDAAIEAVAETLIAVVSEPILLGQDEVVPKAWIGIAVSPADGHGADALLKGAELAASHALAQGTARYNFASQILNAKSKERMKLGLQLRGAVQRGELRVHYQPKLDVARNHIVGAEALVRWQHPEHGMVPPGRFIPLAEELGLMGSIGHWVMENACRDAAGWIRAGLGDISIAVNVSKPQFTAGDLCGTIRQVLRDTGLPAQRLVVELTESMLMEDIEAVIAAMHELKALGVALSIDDFGTGYSSLSYLKRFPLDELKVDRSFIVGLPAEVDAAAIVQTVIELGHRLRMSVTAEGIETADQLESIRQLGCDKYQGYLFSKPVPADQFVQLLEMKP